MESTLLEIQGFLVLIVNLLGKYQNILFTRQDEANI